MNSISRKKTMSFLSFFFIVVILAFSSCGQIDLFEKQEKMPAQQWFWNHQPSFTFHIEDTTSAYHLYVVVRHTDAYPYNNIWLQLGSQFPGDSMKFQKLNLSLGNDHDGWEGTGMDDIFEVRKNISRDKIVFKKPGDYTFSLSQIMRDNPLNHILSVGIRVEKTDQ